MMVMKGEHNLAMDTVVSLMIEFTQTCSTLFVT